MVRFASKAVWRDVVQNWRGIGLFYLLALLALTWLIISLQITHAFHSFIDREIPKIINQVPTLTITNGVVAIDKPEPYILTEPSSKQPVIIIDTTGQTTTPTGQAHALLTRNTLIIRQNDNELRTYDLSKVASFRLDPTILTRWVKMIRTWFFPIIFISALLFTFVWRIILLLLGAAIGMIFVSAFRARLSFAATMRLSAIAMTPGILLSTLLMLTGVNLGCSHYLIGLGLFFLIQIFAIKANVPENPNIPTQGFPVIPLPEPPPPPIP